MQQPLGYCFTTGDCRSGLYRNGQMHRRAALLGSGLDLCGINQNGFLGPLRRQGDLIRLLSDLLPDPFMGY
jgi:hypothetical protein